MQWVTMRNPVNGSVSKVARSAFDIVWEPKGYTLVEEQVEPPFDRTTGSVSSTPDDDGEPDQDDSVE